MGKRSGKRRPFFELSYEHNGEPVWLEDIGQRLHMSGILYQGEGKTIVVTFPDFDEPSQYEVVHPDLGLLNEIIRLSDDPLIVELDENKHVKVFVRKAQRRIAGKVQQFIWARDNFRCMYCQRVMGDVQLTVDHFMPLELGGANDESNYLSACRKCNKRKGSRDPEEWCKSTQNYEWYMDYLEGFMP